MCVHPFRKQKLIHVLFANLLLVPYCDIITLPLLLLMSERYLKSILLVMVNNIDNSKKMYRMSYANKNDLYLVFHESTTISVER